MNLLSVGLRLRVQQAARMFGFVFETEVLKLLCRTIWTSMSTKGQVSEHGNVFAWLDTPIAFNVFFIFKHLFIIYLLLVISLVSLDSLS